MVFILKIDMQLALGEQILPRTCRLESNWGCSDLVLCGGEQSPHLIHDFKPRLKA